MIIDFRVRPPFKEFLGSFLYRPRDFNPPSATMSGLQIGRRRCRSFEERSMDAFMQEMDDAGIDMGVAMGRQSPAPYGAIPNEDVVELVRSYPGRFIGFGGVDGSRGKAAVDEVSRIADMGLKGVAMDNGYCNPPLYDDDDSLNMVYEAIEKNELILSITSSIFVGPDLSYSDPTHIQRVARRFPKLQIVVPHAAWPWTTLMCGVAFQCPNVHLVLDFYGHIPNMPGADEYVKSANYFLGHRTLYASSYPVWPLRQSVEQFSALPFDSVEIRQRCLGGNAARILNL